jgi:serine/threonine protein phosphatase 1
MPGRTFAVGDIHGQLSHLHRLLSRLPPLTPADTIVFIGDYLDRGPQSAQVVEHLRLELPRRVPAGIVTLRGNHEHAWLQVVDRGAPEFVLPVGNGCLATLRSYLGGPPPAPDEFPTAKEEAQALFSASFFPPEVVAWMRELPYYHEDEHAIYVHGGLPPRDGRFAHPRDYPDPSQLVWCRSQAFFAGYRGKRVVFGHTPTANLPQHLSVHTPADRTDLYRTADLIGIDTGCGRGGFLTAVELPSLAVYESRDR